DVGIFVHFQGYLVFIFLDGRDNPDDAGRSDDLVVFLQGGEKVLPLLLLALHGSAEQQEVGKNQDQTHRHKGKPASLLIGISLTRTGQELECKEHHLNSVSGSRQIARNCAGNASVSLRPRSSLSGK